MFFDPTFSGKDVKTITIDEEFTNVNIGKIPSLKPSFKKDGVVTAANASTLNDGASAMLLMSRAKAASLGLKPLALIRSYADAEQAPVDFSTSPSLALPKAYARAGISQSNVDLFEINEAFSAVALANMQILGISHAQINISGGCCSWPSHRLLRLSYIGDPCAQSHSNLVSVLQYKCKD